MNENLNWSDHMKLLLNKTNKNLGVIRRLGKTLPLDILLILYNTLIAPYFEYCNMAWASNSTVIFDRLFCVPKKCYVSLLVSNGMNTRLHYLKKLIF